MDKKRLSQKAQEIANSLTEKTYECWVKQDFPYSYVDEIDGEEVFVEVMLDELNEEYIQLGVAVDDGRCHNVLGINICIDIKSASIVIHRNYADNTSI